MKYLSTTILFVLFFLLVKIESAICQSNPTPNPLSWPLVNKPETKPWTWWWWHGSAVNKADITADLEDFQRSGLGGASIVCLLDVRDSGAVKIPYHSKEWIEMVAHAVREAHRLGMDIDMSPVTGWAFGGPQVSYNDAAAQVDVRRMSFAECQKKEMRIASFNPDTPNTPQRSDLSGVIAKSDDGKILVLTDKVDKTGVLKWAAPKGNWTVYVAINHLGSSRVRLASPGGEGWVVDHLSTESVKRYFEPFNKAFAMINGKDLPRAFNNDSWEIRLNWTRQFPAEFAKRRGYDLLLNLPAFIGEGSNDSVTRVIYDYRQTLNDLMIDKFTRTFDAWATSHGRQTIGEPCDEPGNEIDINAFYDIPQADVGGPANWYFKNGIFNIKRPKITSSAAHILGKPYISSETLTCYGPILDTPLGDAKDKLDFDLLTGINHTMYHGISYSPASARWPGWLFYAGFQLGSFNPMWRQGKKMCDYVTRCQSFLQAGKPQEDVLVYYPIHDYWSQRPKDRKGTERKGTPMGVKTQEAEAPTSSELWHMGYDFAWVTDRLLQSVHVENGQFVAPGSSYKALVIADCRLLPDTTLERIVKYALDGGTIVFPGTPPTDVPGLAQQEQRRTHFQSIMKRIEKATRPLTGTIREARLGKGRILLGGTANEALSLAGVKRETLFDTGLRSIRRVDDLGVTYFIVNTYDNKPFDGWVPITATGANVVLFDPMDSICGIAKYRISAKGVTEVYMQLQPRESRFLRVLTKPANGPEWVYLDSVGQPLTLKGQWQVKFIEGGETIPHPESIDSLTSWTTWNSDQSAALRAFSGTACYSTHFTKPANQTSYWVIDLGKVKHTARIRLNGILLADRFTTPMQVLAGTALKDGDNLLEIEVSNTPINRAADLEIKGVNWQNIMGEDAKSFAIGDFLFPWKKKEAATWKPSSSGLIGPVRLIPMKKKDTF